MKDPVLDAIVRNHRAARAELREGIAALERASKLMTKPAHHISSYKHRTIIITHEFPPIPDRRWDYRAVFDGDDEEPSRHGWGRTEEEARADLLRLEREWAESLQTEEQRLLEEQP